jgi:hypothetical protein
MSDNEEKVAEDGNEPITIRVRDQVRKLRQQQTSAPLLCIAFSGVDRERLGGESSPACDGMSGLSFQSIDRSHFGRETEVRRNALGFLLVVWSSLTFNHFLSWFERVSFSVKNISHFCLR